MNKERLQEIKDSVDFQYKLAKAKGVENALLFTNEEEELIEEIERLNNELKLYKDNHEHLNNLLQQKENIIKEARELLNQEWYSVLRKETITKAREILDKEKV